MSPTAKVGHLLAGVFERIPTILICVEASTTPLEMHNSSVRVGIDGISHLMLKKMSRSGRKVAHTQGRPCVFFFF
jgi:hypothetical protein